MVAVIDTGIFEAHPALQDKILTHRSKCFVEGMDIHNFLVVKISLFLIFKYIVPVVGPRFPVRGGANLVSAVPTPHATTFRKICMSKRKNWDSWGGGVAPGAPPLGSANAYFCSLWPQSDIKRLIIIIIIIMKHNVCTYLYLMYG